MKTLLNIIKYILIITVILLTIWIIFSYIEILFKNINNADYSNLNLIIKLMNTNI